MKIRTLALGGAAVGLTFSMIACKGGEAPPPPPAEAAAAEAPAEAPAEEAEAVGEPGNIKVTIAFEGAAPEMKELNRKADPYCAKTKVVDPSAMVKEGKVANAVVRISSKVKGEFPVPSDPIKINQDACMYARRVSIAQVGQKVEISNGDGTLHNVHAYQGKDEENWFNSAQPPKSPALTKDVGETDMLHFKCDVLPWMNAWVAVADHPFQGVSAEDGTVTLSNVPSKDKAYKLAVWHETFGMLEGEAVVKAGETTEVALSYKGEANSN